MTKNDVLPYVGKMVRIKYNPAVTIMIYPPPPPIEALGVVVSAGDSEFNFQPSQKASGALIQPVVIQYSNLVEIKEPSINLAGFQIKPWMLVIGVGALAYYLGTRRK